MQKKTDAGDPGDWLDFVNADMAAVRLLARHRISFHVCESKLAEALEKAMKADLISRGWRLERVHDLQKLCDHLFQRDHETALRLQPLADELSGSYTESRYPGFDLDAADWKTLEKNLREVTSYVRALRKRLGGRGGASNKMCVL